MSTISIILIAYSAIAIGITIVMLIKHSRPLTALEEIIGRKRKPLWQILLPLPIYPIAVLFVGIVLVFDPQERHKRTMRKFLETFNEEHSDDDDELKPY